MEEVNNHEFFKILKNNLPTEYRIGMNIIEFKDGILYAWNQKESLILSLSIEFQLKYSQQYPVQILRLINPPVFEIERLLINKTSTQCALIGRNGLAIVRVPRRWGQQGIFEDGKSEIFCRCAVLDEAYFACRSSLMVKQARWHPASPNSTHLVVLTTDDTLRLYDVQSMCLKTVWHPERALLSSSTISRGLGATTLQTLASLGETYIDFDFTPPVIVGNVDSPKSSVMWPMLILRGNGDVFVLTASLENKNKVQIDGPLPMYPPADDNYGMEDASSLIVLKSSPPIVVVATCSGNVFHSMLLSFNENDEKLDESIEPESNHPYSNVGLYIFECIELELGISLDDNAELYSSPISLHIDPYVSSRYFCAHEAGLHVIILSMVLELDKYAKCKEDDADRYLPSLRQSQSQIEYLICTRINGEDMSQNVSSPLIGFRVAELPCFLIALSVNGEPTMLPLTPTTLLRKNDSSTEPTSSDNNDLQMENFRTHIENILKPETGSSRPVFKLDPNSNLSPDTYAEFLNQEIDGLREEYFNRYHLAIKDMERRIKLLTTMKSKQIEEVQDLSIKYTEIHEKANGLKALSNKLNEKQELLSTKSHDMLEKMKRKQPKNSAAQKQVMDKLKEYKKIVEKLSEQVNDVCKQQQYQETKMKETAARFEKNDFYLSDDQQTVIADSLRLMGEEISKLKNAQTKIKRTANMLLEKKL